MRLLTRLAQILTNHEDRRTTLMIKNIPNKYDQQMLIAEINERHGALFDFFYLPIDPKVGGFG